MGNISDCFLGFAVTPVNSLNTSDGIQAASLDILSTASSFSIPSRTPSIVSLDSSTATMIPLTPDELDLIADNHGPNWRDVFRS